MSSALNLGRPAAEPLAAPGCDGGMQLISRAAAVLRALEGEGRGLSLGAIARAADLPRATVQRIVDALVLEGLAAVDPRRGGVRLGPTLLRMAGSVHADLVALTRTRVPCSWSRWRPSGRSA